MDKALLEKLLREHPSAQTFGMGAEYLPEWAEQALEYLDSVAEEVVSIGYDYPVEGGEYAVLEKCRTPVGVIWRVRWAGGAPGAEHAGYELYRRFEDAKRSLVSTIRSWMKDIREAMISLEEAGAERDIEHYRGELDKLREQLKVLKSLHPWD